MTDSEHLAALLTLWRSGVALLVASVVVGVALLAIHVAALHGRRLASVQSLRTATSIVLGPVIALPPLVIWPIDLLKVLSLAAVVGFTVFAWRSGRMRDLGTLLTSGAIAWSAYMGSLLILEPGFGVDYRHGMFAAGLGLVVIGTALSRFPPAGNPKPFTPADRYFWIERSIDRAQALGPFRTSTVLAMVVGSFVLIVTFLVLTPATGHLVAAIASALAFVVAAGGALIVGTPRVVRLTRRVNDAISAQDRRAAAAVLGHYPPMTMGQLRGLVDELPDTDPVRPLRVEVLIASGELGEARHQLDRLPVDALDQRLTRASLAELWSIAAGDEDRRGELRTILSEARSPDLRHAATIALACADARRQPRPGVAALDALARLGPTTPPMAVPVWIQLARWLPTAVVLLGTASLSIQVALMLSRL